jgi:hypothetical protein
VIVEASKALGKDFKRICKKYDTKIASFQQNNSFSVEEESSFYQYNVLYMPCRVKSLSRSNKSPTREIALP